LTKHNVGTPINPQKNASRALQTIVE